MGKIFRIRKDVVFGIVCVLWFISAMLAYILIGSYTIPISNGFWMLVLIILILLKNYTKFGDWLETKL